MRDPECEWVLDGKPDALAAALKKQGVKARLKEMKPGETLGL